jgi:hypothetical protein
MSDDILTPAMAVTLHRRAIKLSDLAVWVTTEHEPDHPGVLVARLITDRITPYVLTAATLSELRAMLPPGLERIERQPGDPEGVVEVWVSEA